MAAFMARAVELTPKPARQQMRALAAARAAHEAGNPETALKLLSIVEAGSLDERRRGEVDLMRAWLAFTRNRGSEVSVLLLKAASRIAYVAGRSARLEARGHGQCRGHPRLPAHPIRADTGRAPRNAAWRRPSAGWSTAGAPRRRYRLCHPPVLPRLRPYPADSGRIGAHLAVRHRGDRLAQGPALRRLRRGDSRHLAEGHVGQEGGLGPGRPVVPAAERPMSAIGG
ncbi:hypothetical protein STSP_62620 [Streptomyces jeddahensis]|uniref:Uncharacterized protein n=1 Tax=Streptomyces jeddahensis TaxID=1716141 RepID=A0A177HIH2_9ACTN|nr:hypothetical protein STSP_62620 [Streptomyces jeddahensis]